MRILTRATAGLSPRGRGNRSDRRSDTIRSGSIPAWAGKPDVIVRHVLKCRVYPRVGGETHGFVPRDQPVDGLSPRGRGNQNPSHDHAHRDGSIPAWAGKPRRLSSKIWTRSVYPRVGGETWKVSALQHEQLGLSPRGRGNPTHTPTARASARSIPAWAGKPACGPIRWPSDKVYPRVGGETWRACRPSESDDGLSPRGRGNPRSRRTRTS